MSKRKFNVFREDALHVVKPMCATCIYRPHNRDVGTAVRKEAVAQDSVVVCHSTLDTKPRANAVCGGYYAAEQTPTMELVKALGMVKFVPPIK